MERKAISGMMLTLLLTGMLTLAFNIQPLKAEPTTIVSVYPTTTTALIGETFTINVTITNVSNLFAWQFLMNFDPNVLHVEDVTEGPFLGSTGEEVVFLGPTINNTEGYLIVGSIFMVPLPEFGVTGDGVLATIVFSVVGWGKVTIEIDKSEVFSYLMEVEWADYEKNLGYPPQLIPVTLVDGYFDNRALTAVMDVNPNALNLRSKGKWVTTYIELPEDYDVEDVDVSTILLNAEVPAESSRVCGKKLNVRFERSEVIALLSQVGEVELTVTGKLYDGTPFEARDTIRFR